MIFSKKQMKQLASQLRAPPYLGRNKVMGLIKASRSVPFSATSAFSVIKDKSRDEDEN
jgi:hypothetical protein